jgi:hypothetical protein
VNLGFEFPSLSDLEAKAKALTSEVQATAAAWWAELQRLLANKDALQVEWERAEALTEPDRSERLAMVNRLRQESAGIVDSVLSHLPDFVRAKIEGPKLATVNGLGIVPLIPLAIVGALAVLGVAWMTSSIAKMKDTSARIEAFRSGGAAAAEAVAPSGGSLLSVGGPLLTAAHIGIPAAGAIALGVWYLFSRRKGKR